MQRLLYCEVFDDYPYCEHISAETGMGVILLSCASIPLLRLVSEDASYSWLKHFEIGSNIFVF